MIVLAAALIGAIVGARRAKARGGTRADMVQYGAAHAIAFALAGMVATLVVDRLI